MAGIPTSQRTNEDVRIAQNRRKMGVLLLRKKEESQGLSSGAIVNVVKSKHFPKCKVEVKWCLLTSNVFPQGEIRMDDYFIEYLNSDLKSVVKIQLSDIAQSADFYQPTPGLVLIPVHPTKLSRVLSNVSLKSSVFDYRRTFPTQYFYEDEESGRRLDKCCYIVGSFGLKDSWTAEAFTLITNKDDQGQLEYELQAVDGTIFRTYEEIMVRSHLYPRGAVILKCNGPHFTCIGVLNFSGDRMTISPVFLTPKTLTGEVQLYYPTLPNIKQQVSAGYSDGRNQVDASPIGEVQLYYPTLPNIKQQVSAGYSDGRNQVDASPIGEVQLYYPTLPNIKQQVSAVYSDGRNQVDASPIGGRDETLLFKNSDALGYQIRAVSIPKDGNCLFHAVKDQLTILGQRNHSCNSLRVLAVQELQDNVNDNHLSIDLAPFLTNCDTTTYLEEMSRDGTWAGEMELVALSYALQRPIKVVSSLPVSKPEEAIRTIGNLDAFPILLGYLHKANHYMSLEAQPSQKCNGQGKLEYFNDCIYMLYC
ncbi:hypothetical protein ACROYT_G023377 [Oculina patagonica]